MYDDKNILKIARKVIDIEISAISKLQSRIGEEFCKTVKLISNSEGKLILVAIGKSANIAKKLVATFNSTGQPSVFLHAADALHGDLGNIQVNDIVLFISNSGNTQEIKDLLPFIKIRGNKIISICGNSSSYLVKESDIFLDASVKKEACPNNLAPTSSTAVQLVFGDALAVSLLKIRNFSDKDFAYFHPSGTLGKRLTLKASDLVNEFSKPMVNFDSKINNVILEISEKRVGATAVFKEGKLVGVITDGDLRRMLEKHQDFTFLLAKDIMSNNPIMIQKDVLAKKALDIMEKNKINQLIIFDNNEYIGMIHIHELLKEGI
tara:strand:- start:5172 stop:6134 length:963 start_codon:yes stop_codon:yes gene_type:complete